MKHVERLAAPYLDDDDPIRSHAQGVPNQVAHGDLSTPFHRGRPGDTTDPAVAAKLIDRIAAEVGPPEVLVNTIGAFGPGDALSTTPERRPC